MRPQRLPPTFPKLIAPKFDNLFPEMNPFSRKLSKSLIRPADPFRRTARLNILMSKAAAKTNHRANNPKETVISPAALSGGPRLGLGRRRVTPSAGEELSSTRSV